MLRWTLGTGVSLDRALDRRPAPHVLRRDALGYTRTIWHEFRARQALDFVESPGEAPYSLSRSSFYGKLVTLPGYLSPASFSRGFHDGELSDLAVEVDASEHGGGIHVTADTFLAGVHVQSMQARDGAPRGIAATFGTDLGYEFLLSSAHRYRDTEQALAEPEPPLSYHVPTREEQLGAVHLPGAAIDWHVRAPGLALSVEVRANPSFGGFGAPAFYDWAARNPAERGKHILHRQGYFYGWGGFGSLAGRLALGPLRVAASLTYARTTSLQGLDRHSEQVTDDVSASSERLSYDAALGVAATSLPLELELEFGVQEVRSEVQGFHRRARALRRGFALTLPF
jgi:hypothetical protein